VKFTPHYDRYLYSAASIIAAGALCLPEQEEGTTTPNWMVAMDRPLKSSAEGGSLWPIKFLHLVP